MTDVFCSLPWFHALTKPNGGVKPCCRYNKTLDDNLTDQSLTEIFQSPEMNSIRSDMIKGVSNINCEKCYREERNGKKSYRQIVNEYAKIDIDNPQIEYIEFALSNFCNLKCRSCRSELSTSWYEDDIALGNISKSSPKIIKLDLSKIDIDLKALKRVRFTGGEPLISPEHNLIIEKMNPDGMILKYSTNCTVFPKDHVLEFWKKVRRLHIDISIDGYGPVNDYFRSGTEWNKIQLIFDRYFQLKNELGNSTMKLKVHTVANMTNIHSLLDIRDWVRRYPGVEWSIDCLTDPKYISLQNMPQGMKEQFLHVATELNESHIEKSILTAPNVLWNESLMWIKRLDTIRNTDITTIAPHFKDFL